MLVWASDTSHCRSRGPPPDAKTSCASANEPQSCTEYHSALNRPQSPMPKRGGLPKFFDIGHCAVACSGRCSLHSPKQEASDSVKEARAPIPGVAESLQTRQKNPRHHGNSRFQRDANQNPWLSSSTNRKESGDKRHDDRLDQGWEALLNGDVAVARQVVAAELERLNGREPKSVTNTQKVGIDVAEWRQMKPGRSGQ